MIPLFDAHNHLADRRLDGHRGELIEELPRLGLHGAVVNGTREEDWPLVAALAEKTPWVHASYGLHPWHVGAQSPAWRATLEAALAADPRAGVGEIGLDRWLENHDDAAQMEAFAWQWSLAARENRPVTVHCLKAWGPLTDFLRNHLPPERGFLLHSYSGPVELIGPLARLGAYFSISPAMLRREKWEKTCALFEQPARLLFETDAPDMPPPLEANEHLLRSTTGEVLLNERGQPLNSPANIALVYAAATHHLGLAPALIAELIAQNFHTFFGSSE